MREAGVHIGSVARGYAPEALVAGAAAVNSIVATFGVGSLLPSKYPAEQVLRKVADCAGIYGTP